MMFKSNQILLYQKMIRQSQRLDTIKLYVHLISKIKKGEEIDLSNRLLSTQFKNISNKQIKLMLEIQSLHYENITPQEIKQFQESILAFRELTNKGTQDYKIYTLLLLKLHSVPIVKVINAKKAQDFSQLASVFISKITNLQEYRYILQALFHFKSVIALQRADISKIQQKYNNRKQINHLLFIIALVKATISSQQASIILKKLNYNPSILQQKRYVILFLKQLATKQRYLLANKAQEESLDKSFLPVDNSAKTVIKNSIQFQCKIEINQENQAQTFKKINTNLDQNLYLYAYPLVHIYYQKNPEIIESVKSTELYKYLITSKSFLVQNSIFTSNIGSNIVMPKAKTQKKQKKNLANPANFVAYYKASEQANLNACVPICRGGAMFIKHNFGNLSSSNKFVKVTAQGVEYHKTSDLSDSGTHWQMSEAMGIVYGKMTARQLQNQNGQPEHCFSFILRDRTFDLSIDSKNRISQLHQFIRGSSALLNQYHQKEKEQWEEKLNTLVPNKKKKIEELNDHINYHDSKIQKQTKGKLLWSQLILTLNKKISFNPQTGKTYLKLQGIKKIRNKIQKK